MRRGRTRPSPRHATCHPVPSCSWAITVTFNRLRVLLPGRLIKAALHGYTFLANTASRPDQQGELPFRSPRWRTVAAHRELRCRHAASLVARSAPDQRRACREATPCGAPRSQPSWALPAPAAVHGRRRGAGAAPTPARGPEPSCATACVTTRLSATAPRTWPSATLERRGPRSPARLPSLRRDARPPAGMRHAAAAGCSSIAPRAATRCDMRTAAADQVARHRARGRVA
jgi:hypothetical protein